MEKDRLLGSDRPTPTSEYFLLMVKNLKIGLVSSALNLRSQLIAENAEIITYS
ncbi:hypothetical protein [Microcoleus sp. FACHB-831]|uniref:hypothetical protein n=1 Tax=Microcoleus sp. FACHB-831 TaxID=2692827 RepID=UPI001688670F|nr:hypothetical protein [Microcoleus sp. FACHB-831]